jgi:hypothetical protein
MTPRTEPQKNASVALSPISLSFRQIVGGVYCELTIPDNVLPRYDDFLG